VKYALNKLGIADPARQVQNFVERAAPEGAWRGWCIRWLRIIKA
jgi:hypothetical protein